MGKIFKKFSKIIYIFLLVLLVSLLPIFRGGNLYKYISMSVNNPVKKLSAERQAVYDKMKVNSLNIKERNTGTAPFNIGESSNIDGVDVTDKDDYIRTFDKISYLIEVGIGPNVKAYGVSNSSIFKGGVIKVKATLPNQGSDTIMRWETDAWMRNVSLKDDSREIYAEYYVDTEESVTNAIQNLSFTIKVDGYKKEITDDMKPTFEIWMEGNKNDNTQSSASSMTIKDNKDIIISGHPSYDVEFKTPALTNNDKLNEEYIIANNLNDYKNMLGYINSIGIGISLRQDVNGFTDLRGVEYPKDKITMELSVDYSNKSSFTKIEVPEELNDRFINSGSPDDKRIILAYNRNMRAETSGKLYNKNVTHVNSWSLPYGSGNSTNTVQDTGDVTASLDGNKLTVTMENYKLNGKFPINPASGYEIFPDTIGYFGAINIQFFNPYYIETITEDGKLYYKVYDGTISYKINNLKYTTIDGEQKIIEQGSNNTVKDVNVNNNVANFNMTYNVGASLGLHCSANIDSRYYWPDAYAFDGREFTISIQNDISDSPSMKGGTDDLIVWNPKVLEIIKYNANSYYSFSHYSMLGYQAYDTSTIKSYFGVYKNDNENGPQTPKQLNAAVYEDFDWYEDIDEAKTHGSVSAFYFTYPANEGKRFRYYIGNRFRTHVSEEDFGKTTFLRVKGNVYADKERTKVYHATGNVNYFSETYYVPTQYNDKGLVNYGSNYSQGETILMIQAMANSTTSVEDKDINGNIKSVYDVQDSEINVVVTPTLTDGKTASNNDKKMNDIYVRTTLPVGLSYRDGSASIPPIVTMNSDGTTLLEWKYDEWQINHPAPDDGKITFKADISASLENNKELEIFTTTEAPYDIRALDKYRTSSYKISITNLLGVQAIKETNKKIIDKNESFIITNILGNNSEEELENIQGIEFLPGKDESNDSEFNGTYYLKVLELANNQKLYYTTENRNNLDVEVDSFGKDIIKGIDLDTDSRWVEINDGDIIPSDATAIATSISKINSLSKIEYKLEVNTTNNKESDMYAFSIDLTTNNTGLAVSSNTAVVKVVNRKISGIYFEDLNDNNLYDSEDNLLKGKTVKLVKDNREIAEIQTDDNGRYEFEKIDNGKYIIEFEKNNNYEVVTKGNGENSSKVNSDYKTDTINHTMQATTENYMIDYINAGIKKKKSKIITHHIYKDTNIEFKTETQNKYFGETYTTNVYNDIPVNYEFCNKSNNFEGTANESIIDVNYFYNKKASSVEINVETSGTEEITSKSEEVNYKIVSTGSIGEYSGEGKIITTILLPYEIDESISSLDDGVYDNSNKTITWITNKNIDTYSNLNSNFDIEKNIKLVYKDIDSTKRQLKNVVNTNIILDNNTKTSSSNLVTDTNIKGKIVVKYYKEDKNNEENELLDSEEFEDLVGNKMKVPQKNIDGYVLSNDINTTYTYLDNEQEIILVYKHKEKTINPNTGDNIIKFIVIAAISSVVIVGLILIKKKNNR